MNVLEKFTSELHEKLENLTTQVFNLSFSQDGLKMGSGQQVLYDLFIYTSHL